MERKRKKRLIQSSAPATLSEPPAMTGSGKTSDRPIDDAIGGFDIRPQVRSGPVLAGPGRIAYDCSRGRYI